MKLDVSIPTRGEPRDEVLARMRASRTDDADYRGGRTWSLVYHAGEEHEELLREAYGLFISENFLNPMAFKSLKRMEAEVVSMTTAMLHGDDDSVGTMTSGGTESILLAVKAARERARTKWPWILRPQLVAPASVHVAFEKACHYFGVKLVSAPLAADFRVDLRALKRRVGRNTILIAASAPQFPHGVIDPIEEIGAFAQRKGIPFHVDACIGGFLLPWIEANGVALPRWDFRVPGVTSISADVHKYGYASKGASVIAYSNMEYLRQQFFVSTDWCGGIYASPTMAGTRPGGAIAAAWAAMRTFGQDGYREMAKQTMEATRRYVEGVRSIPELEVLGEPQMSLVAFRSRQPKVDVYAIADRLDAKGWNVDRQQNPASVHASLTSNHLRVLDAYLADLREAVDYVKRNPQAAASGTAPMYGMMAKVPMRGMVKRSVRKVMEQMFGPDGGLGNLAELNAQSSAGDPVMQLVDRYGPKALELLRKAEHARDQLADRVRDFMPGGR